MNDFLTPFLSYATLVIHIVLVCLLILFFFQKENKIFRIIFKNGILLSFVLAFVSTGISLYYSDYVGFEPCVLCWYQRIPMYALAIILYLSIARKDDKSVIPYGLALSVVGTILAIYHTYLAYFSQGSNTCSPFSSVSCTTKYFNYFGYISVPTLSLSAFVIITLLLIGKKKHD
ncbi:disulfide bond formation protein B [Candidatus Nomurabacteria bacterium]|nr:disulfide bond formation protein B [Candidatus Nomurabacteria bacterium]